MSSDISDTSDLSDRSRLVALILAGILGPFGAHRFYTGKIQSGVLMALTLGGLGIWYLYDVIVVASGAFRDSEGRLVASWDMEEARHPGLTGQLADDVLQELGQLRREVLELHERVDFTERLLADPERRDRGGDAPPPRGLP